MAQIYVGTYGKYNQGSLEGKWMTVEDYETKEEFMDACRELHKDERDPEFMFQDWEDVPDGMISESWVSPVLFYLCSELDEGERGTFFDWYDEVNGGTLHDEDEADKAVSEWRDKDCGAYVSVSDFAYDMAQEIYGSALEEGIGIYFDYDKWERDLMWDYDYVNGHIYRKY